MTNLTHQDFQSVLKAVEILNSGIEPESLPERMLNSVNYAVAGDITAFEMFNQAGEHQGILIYEPFDAISPQELEIYAQYVGEHPFYEAIIVDHRLEAIKIAISFLIKNSQ